ncbi:hypothetical protein GCM10010231_14870 [Streptomyces sindenensis]|nr:hypothetical protein GCM10010231_14870 [Streptomyces sindenensis]
MQAASGHERRTGVAPSPPQQGFRQLREPPPGREREARDLKRHVRDHTWHVHIPRRMHDLRNPVRTTRCDLIRAA